MMTPYAFSICFDFEPSLPCGSYRHMNDHIPLEIRYELSSTVPGSADSGQVLSDQRCQLLSRLMMIQVLQEAAAARCVSIACGRLEIPDRHLLQSLSWISTHFTEGNSPVPPLPAVLPLMSDGAIFSRRLSGGSPGTDTTESPTLNLMPISELSETFRHHNATDVRDKVYALLGLSSDNHGASALKVDYTKPWDRVFEEAIRKILDHSVKVTTWIHRQRAVITSPGCAIGTIGEIDLEGSLWIRPSPAVGYGADKVAWIEGRSFRWPETVRYGDLVCFLQGARYPSVIRPCGDHFDIVAIEFPLYEITVQLRIDVRNMTADEYKAKFDERLEPTQELLRGPRGREDGEGK